MSTKPGVRAIVAALACLGAGCSVRPRVVVPEPVVLTAPPPPPVTPTPTPATPPPATPPASPAAALLPVAAVASIAIAPPIASITTDMALAALAEQGLSATAPIATPATAADIAALRALGPATPSAAIPSEVFRADEASVTISGRIQRIARDSPGVPNTGGYMVVGDTTIIIPKNLIIDFVAARYSLDETFQLAPEPYKSRGLSGLALEDGPPNNHWVATVLANKMGSVLIAGKIDLAKLPQAIEGTVTFIDYARGEWRMNGDAAGTTGTRCRLNDPLGVYSKQPPSFQTGPGNNGSADIRPATDPQNPIVTAATGYPMRIPSIDPAKGSDPLAPLANRNQAIDSAIGGTTHFFAGAPTLQAPVLVGDHVVATGSFEIDPGPDGVFGTADDVRFLSVSQLDDRAFIFTNPGDPCYVRPEAMNWLTPPFRLRRAELRVVGHCTDPSTAIELRILRRDPTTGAEFPEPFASTTTQLAGAIVLPGGHFKIVLSIDLGGGGGRLPLDPGANILTLARDLQVVAANQNGSGAKQGAPGQFLNMGSYTTPITFTFPDPEPAPTLAAAPFEFRNIPFLVDGDGTPRSSGPLDPFPGVETRPNAFVLTVRKGTLVTRASVGLPSIP